jgi:small GTP-binding protein
MWTQSLFGRKRLLTDRQAALVNELRDLLQRLSTALEHFGLDDVAQADMRALKDTQEQLEELFLVVIVGEFNSGKSSFINALLGAHVQPEGVTPTTDRITLIRYGEEPAEEQKETFMLDRSYPAEVLRQLTIVDTPGTNAVIRRHEELTHTFIPRADIVIFITSADRPFTESERAFLEMIKEWGKKIVLIVNKLDILHEDELGEVLEFVEKHTYSLIGRTPDMFPVSSRFAIHSRREQETNDGDMWNKSRFAAVERYIIEVLDEETRIRLKLLSPLGVAEHLTAVYLKVIKERLEVLQDDFNTLDNIEQQLGYFRDDLLSDVEYHLNEIDLILHEVEQRGLQFFDDMLRLERIFELRKSDVVQAAFEKEVIGDVAQQIEQRIHAIVDWTVEKNLRLWQNITQYLNQQRVTQHRTNIIGGVGDSFDYNRNALIESVGQVARQVVNSYDREQESEALFEEIRGSLTNTVITEAAAVGIGAALVVLFHTFLLDLTGILFAAVLALGGFFILPAKRRKAKHDFRQRISEMRTQVREAVQAQFEKEAHQSISRIHDTIAPYTRFVRSRREKLLGVREELRNLEGALERLRADIES